MSLSAERAIDPYPEILPDARRVRVPTFHVGSREDSYTRLARDTRELYRATPAQPKRLLIVPGFAHGTELLEDARVRSAVIDFLSARVPG